MAADEEAFGGGEEMANALITDVVLHLKLVYFRYMIYTQFQAKDTSLALVHIADHNTTRS